MLKNFIKNRLSSYTLVVVNGKLYGNFNIFRQIVTFVYISIYSCGTMKKRSVSFMKVNPITFTQSNQQNQTSFQRGLYFVQSPTVLFDKTAKLDVLTKKIVSSSEEGYRYIEATAISPKIKEKIANIPFVKGLAEKFDTFVYLSKPFKNDYYNKHYSHLKIKWADSSKDIPQKCDVIGSSPVSSKAAVSEMIKNLETQEFF